MEMSEIPEGKSLNQTDTDAQVKKSKHPISFFLELLSDSVITGVPQIVIVRSVIRKIFKIIILSVCFAGFIYQAVKFMELYFTYPSSLDVELKYNDNLPIPAVTICNKNPIQKTPYCKDFPEKCAKPTNLTSFCDEYPYYCDHNTTVDDLQFVINDKSLFDEDIMEKYHQEVDDFITACCAGVFGITSNCRRNSKLVKYMKENRKKQYCSIIDFGGNLKNISGEELYYGLNEEREVCLSLSPFAFEEKYTLVINLDPKEYTRPDRTVAAQAVVHAYNNFKNPFAKGFMMKEGKRYIVTLNAFEEYLLPAPYATNCTENDKLHEDYNREACFLNCTLNSFMEKCNCIPIVYVSGDDLPECNIQSTFDCIQHEDDEFCLQQCPRPCYSFSFQYTVSESDIENDFEDVDLQDNIRHMNAWEEDLIDTEKSHYLDMDGKVILDIVYDSKEVTTFTYKPKYEQIEILGYIGGFIGIWLGLNLVAVIDFFESVVVFLWWLIHRKKIDQGNRR